MMNLLEHYVKEIYSETDISEEYERKTGEKLSEKMFCIDVLVDCYGVRTRSKEIFMESELKRIKERGFYLA